MNEDLHPAIEAVIERTVAVSRAAWKLEEQRHNATKLDRVLCFCGIHKWELAAYAPSGSHVYACRCCPAVKGRVVWG